MAKNEAKQEIKESEDKAPALVNPSANLKALYDAQIEGTDSDSFAIPFIKVLQSNSPQCTEGKSDYDKDARPGEIYNTVTKARTKEITIIPVRFKREFLEWKPDRGGLVNRRPPKDPAVQTANVNERNQKYLDNGNILQDTRQHFVLVVDGPRFAPALLPMSSTQIKKSKNLLFLVQEAQQAGKLPSFKLTTTPESNAKGNWYGWRVTTGDDYSTNERAIAEALVFAKALAEDRVRVDETEFGDTDVDDSAPFV